MQGPGRTLTGGVTAINFMPITGTNMTLDGRTIVNTGTATWTAGNIAAFNGAVWNNLPGSTFDVRSDLSFNASGGVTPVFNNAGTFRKSIGNARTTMGIVFNNDGAVEVQVQTLALTGGGRSTGTFSISDSAAMVNFTGASYLLTTGTAITGAGIAKVDNQNGGLFVDAVVAVDNFESAYDGLTIAPTGHLVVNHVFNWVYGLIAGLGTLDITAGAFLNISGSLNKTITGLTINNAGTATWTGTGDIVARQYAVFNNLAGAVFDIRNNQSFILAPGEPPSSSVFNNAGIFKKTLGGGLTTIGVRFNNTGTVDIQSGTVNFTDGGP
jgi:hypothetical protein